MPPQLTFAEIRRERKEALRDVRKVQRAMDSSIERLERRIFTLLNRKTVIDRPAALTLVPLWNNFIETGSKFQRALADFIEISSV